MNTPKRVIASSVVGGFSGWAIENVLFASPGQPRYSALLPGVPFLPVYAVGGAVLAGVEPFVRKSKLGVVGKFLVYGALLGGLEAVAGYAERWEGRQTWDYDGAPTDLKHAALWGVVGVLSEGILK